MPVDWLPPDPSRLGQFKNQSKEARRSRPEVPCFAASTIESWPPAWIGARLSYAERKTVLASRQGSLDSFAAFLGNVITFLMSHVAIGELPVDAAFAHVGVLVRMADELTVSRAVEYFRRLQSVILADIRGGARFDLAERLASVDDAIFNRMLVERPRARSRSAGKGVKSAVARAPPVEKTTSKASGAPPPFPPSGKGGGKSKGRPPVCLDHDPAAGRRCSVGSACEKEHPDTSDASGADRFARAKAAYEKAVASRSARAEGKVAKESAPPPSNR